MLFRKEPNRTMLKNLEGLTREQAEELLRGTGENIDTSSLLPHLQMRLETAGDHAYAAVDRGENSFDKPAYKTAILNARKTSLSTGERTLWLRKAADVMLEAYGPHSACKSGCSHCCHIPVTISQAEAHAIGRVTGRTPTPPAKLQPVEIRGYESPCPFLDKKTQGCSIYQERPFVCRSHMNMDEDELLCKLIEGEKVPVPYMDTRQLHLVALEIQPKASLWADIREWFPS